MLRASQADPQTEHQSKKPAAWNAGQVQAPATVTASNSACEEEATAIKLAPQDPSLATTPAVRRGHVRYDPHHCSRVLLADAAMVFCQILFFVNHVRRLLDASYCTRGDWGAPLPPALTTYPCAATRSTTRVAFLLLRLHSTFTACLSVPRGELWVPVVTTVIFAQAVAIALMPRRAYLAYGRRACMMLVGLLPKATSLACFLAFPRAAPSTYFSTYFPLEGAITVWQQLVYNYPFWPGLAVLAAHCALTTAICVIVGANKRDSPLFSIPPVLLQTYGCAALAAAVSLQQQPTTAWVVLRPWRRSRSSGSTEGARPAEATVQATATSSAEATVEERGGSSPAIGAVSAAVAAEPPAREATAPSTSGSDSSSWLGAGLLAAVRRFVAAAPRLTGRDSSSTQVPTAGRSGSFCSCGSGSCGSVNLSRTCSYSASSSSSPPSSAGDSGNNSCTACVARALVHAEAEAMRACDRTQAPKQQRSARDQDQGTKGKLVQGPDTQHQQRQQLSHIAAAVAPASAGAADMAEGAHASFTAMQGMPQHHEAQISAGAAGATARPANGDASTSSPAALQALSQTSQRPSVSLSPGTAAAPARSPTPSRRISKGSGAAGAGQRVAVPPAGAFSLKQPKGLSAVTIVEDEEFQPGGAAGGRMAGVSGTQAVIAQLAAHGGPGARYRSRAPPQRIYMKIPWAEPDQLPGNFLERLNAALSSGVDCMAVGATARSGCIELVFDVVPRTRSHGQIDGDGAHSRRLSAAFLFDEEDAGEQGALEDAALSGLLEDTDTASWIHTLHLQPPPGAEVLTQACGRVWISRWDHIRRQWVPERLGGVKPSSLPRIAAVEPVCIVPQPAQLLRQGPAAAAGAAVPCVRLTVSCVDSAPSFSARCRGRYLPVSAQYPAGRSSSGNGATRTPASPPTTATASGSHMDVTAAAAGADGGGCAVVSLELLAGLPRNGLVVLECKVGRLLSNWRPLLVTDDARLAAELATLYESPPAKSAGVADGTAAAAGQPADDGEPPGCDELLTDLGLWLDFVEVLGLTGHARTPASASSGHLAAVRPGAGSRDTSSGSVERGVEGLEGSDCGERHGAGAAAAATGAVEELSYSGSLSSGGSGRSGGSGSSSGSSGPLAREKGSLDFGPGLAALYATEPHRAHMCGIAVSLLEFAVDRGWTHTSALLVDQLLAAGVSWRELLGRCSGGLTLLHRAVRSGRPDCVGLVVALGERHGAPFDWQALAPLRPDATPSRGAAHPSDPSAYEADAAALVSNPGPQDHSHSDAHAAGCAAPEGVTPLHLAAALPDGGWLAERILREYEAACALWASARDSHGLRPLDCARASGHMHLADAGWEASSAAAAGRLGRAAERADEARQADGEVRAILVASAARASRAERKSSKLESDGGADGCGGVAAGLEGAAGATAAQRVVGGRWSTWMVGTARELHAALTAPFTRPAEEEARYVRAIGARYITWMSGYAMFELAMCSAVGGRMVKEGRPGDMVAMILFGSSHALSAILACISHGAWLRRREALVVNVTLARTAAKLLPALGLLPYPHSARMYMTGGMDVFLEGVLPIFFEQIRAPYVLALRAFEGFATGLLYDAMRVVPGGTLPALSYALTWNLGSGLLAVALEVRQRRALAAVAAVTTEVPPACGKAAFLAGMAVGKAGRMPQGAGPSTAAGKGA